MKLQNLGRLIMDKLIYTWKNYHQDIKYITELLKGEDVHLVSIYRGSLVMGAQLSNILNVPLSVVQFQTRDGEDKIVKKGINKKIHKKQILYILDDILDSGITMTKVKKYYITKGIQKENIKVITLFWNSNLSTPSKNMTCLHDSEGRWVQFPWEV